MCHVTSFPSPKPGHSESSEAATVKLLRKSLSINLLRLELVTHELLERF